MLARLLAKVLPAVYADPDRARPCAGCGKMLAHWEQERDQAVSGVVCGPACATEAWASRAG